MLGGRSRLHCTVEFRSGVMNRHPGGFAVTAAQPPTPDPEFTMSPRIEDLAARHVPRAEVLGRVKPSHYPWSGQTIVSAFAGSSIVQRKPSVAKTRSTRPPNSYLKRSLITLLP